MSAHGRKTTTLRGLTLMALALCVAASTPIDTLAQRRGRGTPRGPAFEEPTTVLGIHLIGADPLGEFGQVVDDGFGADLSISVPVAARGAFRLRADLGGLIYGRERRAVCFPVPVGCRIGLDLTTNNTIVFLGVGPEITVPEGPVRPYVNATAGFSYFATTSSLSGDDDFDDFATTRNFDDLVGSVALGGGVRMRVAGGRKPVFVDVGARYHQNGVAEYLREGDIVDHPDGSITIFPNRSEANLVTYRIGVSFGVGGGRSGRR